MIPSPRRRLATALIASALLIGCAGKDGASGAQGAEGYSTLVQIATEPAGAKCANGGTRIQSGVDSNRSGVLEATEVGSAQFVCNGANGSAGHDSVLSTSPEGAGPNCANGGIRVQSGLDLDDDRTLDAVEVTSTQYVCGGANGSNGADGLTALVATLAEPAGSNCGTGGIRVQSGVDADADGTLDPAEIVLTRFVCNGADGSNGANGTDGLTALVNATAEAAGANCAAGGTRLDAGLDSNRDGILGAGETTSTQYACDGAAGAPGADGAAALLALSSEPAGGSCAAGGTRVDAGLDLDRDGTLDASEISSTRFLCNGTDGVNGLTSLVATVPEAPGSNCLHGGVRVQSGLDADRDALLDPAEIAGTQYICNGADGTSGLSALVATASEANGPNCQYGGTRVDSGLDADRDGTLDAGEIALTQYVCGGAPGAGGTPGSDGLTALVSMAAVSPGAGCQYGGTRIDAGLDADRDGTLDPAEIAATQYACNGATGTAPLTLLALAPEPAGANCPYGGTRVQSGLDTDGSGVLDAGEVQVTQYVCNGDTTHPTIVTVTPAPGSAVPPTASFCAVFSEPLDPTSIDDVAMTLEGPLGSLQGQVTYDAGALRACFLPAGPLDLFTAYKLHIGGAGSSIRDLAGNQLIGEFAANYWVDNSVPIPDLRVTIDSVVQNGGQVDVTWTVRNDGFLDAGPFQLGLFLDPAVAPGVGAPADAIEAIAGLAQGATFSSTSSLAGTPSFVFAFVDLLDQVMEQNEADNLTAWGAPGAIPALTGAVLAAPSTQEEGFVVTVTIPVNASARRADVFLSDDFINPMGFRVPLGTLTGNTAGEGVITGDLTLPPGTAGVHAFGVMIGDATGAIGTGYAWFSLISNATLAAQEVTQGQPGSIFDSGFPLTFLTVAPSTRPNLTVRIDGVSPSAGGVDVAYTVSNTGISDSGPFTLGLFIDQAMPPGVGSPADAAQDFPLLTAGTSVQGMVTLSADPTSSFYAFVDLTDAVQESNEGDNLASAMPTPPVATLTGPVGVQPPSVLEGQPVDLFIPVNAAANVVNITAVGAPGGPNEGMTIGVGQFWGNFGGEGFLAGQVVFPPGFGGDWILEFEVADASWTNGTRYFFEPAVSGVSYAAWSSGNPVDSGIPLATVTVTPDLRPNLTIAIDSVSPNGAQIDVAFTVTNSGNGDAAPSTVGLWVDPGTYPGPGMAADFALAIGAVPAGGTVSGTATLSGFPSSNVFAYADLDLTVDETNENDNLGGITPAMTGSPVVAPAIVEQTGGLVVTVPVNGATRGIEVHLTMNWPSGADYYLGNAGGNYGGEGSITGNFTVPTWINPGDYTVSVTVANEGWINSRYYVDAPAQSATTYAVWNPASSFWLPTSSLTFTGVTVTPPTHANLMVRIETVTEGAGTIDVRYTLINNGFADAGGFTLGLFADPLSPPGLGASPDVSIDVAGLAAGTQIGGTATLTGTQASALYAFVDLTDAVLETNEGDNLARPQPALVGPATLSPSIVDEGTVLTVTIPVNPTTQRAEVFLGSPGPQGIFIGDLNGNHSMEGFLTGTVWVPVGASSLGTTPVTFRLSDDWGTMTTEYEFDPGLSPDTYVVRDPMSGMIIGDSGIPIASVTVVVPTRPNLTVSIDAVTDMGDGTVNVDYTVRNTGAGDAGTFDLGLFVDPATIPDPGTPASATLSTGPLPLGAAVTGTVNVTGTPTSALFAYADLGGAVDEQSETDNLGWSLPPPQMTGQPTLSADPISEGSPVTVTVPVSAGVRRVEVYLGAMMTAGGGDPAFMIGEVTLPASATTVDVACVAPPGSAGSWDVWIATYDAYGLSMQAYVSFEPVSTTHYTEFDPNTGSWPPSVLTTIPLTTLDITP